MSEKKQVVELFPKGKFIIHRDNEGDIKGRFSMHVLDRFCESHKLENYLDLLEKITAGMTIGDYADLILMAVEDYFRGKEKECGFDAVGIMDMVDDVFENGIRDDDFEKLIHHAIGRVADIKKINEAIKNLTAAQIAEKKSE